jgi:hypothetical protein
VRRGSRRRHRILLRVFEQTLLASWFWCFSSQTSGSPRLDLHRWPRELLCSPKFRRRGDSPKLSWRYSNWCFEPELLLPKSRSLRLCQSRIRLATSCDDRFSLEGGCIFLGVVRLRVWLALGGEQGRRLVRRVVSVGIRRCKGEKDTEMNSA